VVVRKIGGLESPWLVQLSVNGNLECVGVIVRFECCGVDEEVMIPGSLDKLHPVKG